MSMKRPDVAMTVQLARAHPASEQDLRVQRVSFAYGNVKLENSRVTRAAVQDIASGLRRR